MLVALSVPSKGSYFRLQHFIDALLALVAAYFKLDAGDTHTHTRLETSRQVRIVKTKYPTTANNAHT